MENQTNEQPVKMGKILTGVSALLSSIIVFFFNVNVFFDMGRWGNYLAYFRLLAFLASLAFVILNVITLVSKNDKRTVFILAAIIEVALSGFLFLYYLISRIVLTVKYDRDFHFPLTEFFQLILCIGLFVGLIICNKKFPARSSACGTSQAAGSVDGVTVGNAQSGQVQGYYSLTTHVLLMIFVGSIWRLIWIYRVNKYLNSRTDFNRNATTSLLLCMFVPFYGIYWIYKAAQEIDKLGAPYNREQIATICLICEIFFAIASPIIMQKKINEIIDAENGNVAGNTNYRAANRPEVNQPAVNSAEELKKYKQLLDEGAITQDEYDAIKAKYLKEIINAQD